MLYLGIDFGTSGARAVVITADGVITHQVGIAYGDSDLKKLPQIWQDALFGLILQIPEPQRQQINAIAIDGTSGTVMVCDRNGHPVEIPLLYNDGRAAGFVEQIKQFAPPQHTVMSATSGLAKLLWLRQQSSFSQAEYLLHQADWLAFLLHGKLGVSDYHNALKLGYDVAMLAYPQWFDGLNLGIKLPQVLTPGTPIGTLKSNLVKEFGFSPTCQICAGTTDSIAAFFASGAAVPGEAVTSLGSSIALKLLSQTHVDNSTYGIYSHRFPDFPNSTDSNNQPIWLVGGSSNTGGAVLRHFFNDDQLATLSAQINPDIPSQLDYYPILQPGDRFPINDPNLPPRLTPRPESDVEFLHGLLTSMARIESQGYQLLQQFGANRLTRVYTAGGGAKNQVWSKIRQNLLQVPIVNSPHREAAYGSALLAMKGMRN